MGKDSSMSKVLKTNIQVDAKITVGGYDMRIEGIPYYELSSFFSSFNDWTYQYEHDGKAWFTQQNEQEERKVIGIPSSWLVEGFDESRIHE